MVFPPTNTTEMGMTRSVAAAIAALCVLAGAHAQCVCPAIYAPVCDLASGVTYSNDCAAVPELITLVERIVCIGTSLPRATAFTV